MRRRHVAWVPSLPDERHRNRRVRPRPLVRRDDVLEALAWVAVVVLGAVCAFAAAFI
jgi:hypothetical protein